MFELLCHASAPLLPNLFDRAPNHDCDPLRIELCRAKHAMLAPAGLPITYRSANFEPVIPTSWRPARATYPDSSV